MLNYIFYIFIISLTGIVILILDSWNKKIMVRSILSNRVVDYLFVFSGLILLFLKTTDSTLLIVEIVKYGTSFILLFFLPGWIFVRLLRITEKIHKIPMAVI